MAVSDLTLQELKGSCIGLFKIRWKNLKGRMKFVQDHYVDIGSRRRADDHFGNVAEVSAGSFYDTSSSTAIQSGNGYEQITNKEMQERLSYAAGHWFLKRDDYGQLNAMMKILDPTDKGSWLKFRQAFMEAYGKVIDETLRKGVEKRRLGVLDALFDALYAKTAHGGEKVFKLAGDVSTGQVSPFVNVITTALSDAALNDMDDLFGEQLDTNGMEIGDQVLKYLWVNQSRAAGKILSNPAMHDNANFRNILTEPVETLKWNSATPNANYFGLSDQHAVRLVGRSWEPEITVVEQPDGIYIIADDHTVGSIGSSVGSIAGKVV